MALLEKGVVAMDYGFFDEILKEDFPDIYEDLHSEQSDLAVELIQYRLSLQMDPSTTAFLLGMDTDSYLEYEFANTDIPAERFHILIDQIRKLNDIFSIKKRISDSTLSVASNYYQNSSLDLMKTVFVEILDNPMTLKNNKSLDIKSIGKLSFKLNERIDAQDSFKVHSGRNRKSGAKRVTRKNTKEEKRWKHKPQLSF